MTDKAIAAVIAAVATAIYAFSFLVTALVFGFYATLPILTMGATRS